MTKIVVPEKLKDDCIIEALCEVRFHTEEQPEIVIGRLGDKGFWRTFSKNRLPAADIPGPIRAANEQLKYQPVLELRSADGTQLVKVGANVVSYHNIGKYCGWKAFEPILTEVFTVLFENVANAQVNRLGFRYVNAITSTRHFIAEVGGLALRIEIAGEKVGRPVNLNYLVANDESHQTMTRIASPEFVQGQVHRDTTAIVDIDVFSPNGYVTGDMNTVSQWTRSAHDFEKEAFFKLIPSDVLSQLVEN